MSQTDREYVQCCLDGHPEAFGELVRRYQERLLAYLTGRLGDPEKAEEVAQEAFVRSYFALRKLKKPDSFFSWLFGIAGSVAREQQRAERRQSEIARSLLRRPTEQAVEQEASLDVDLDRAIAALPEPYRETILLRYCGGMSCREVAGRLGVRLGTVTMRLSRAYAMLRDSLDHADRSQQCSEA